LLTVEMVSALNRRVREATLPPADYRRMRDIFDNDCRTLYQITPLTPAIIDLACQLLERYPLRGYDAIHLATALTAQHSLQKRGLSPLVFLSADNRLNETAAAEGLSVDNPNHHP
jgi:predicted nucleic acid-binding protein